MPRTRSSVRRSRSRAASAMPAASARSRSRPVGLDQRRPLLLEEVGGQAQGVVAHGARRPRHHPGGRPDAARELLQMPARSSGQVTSTRSSRWTTTWLRRAHPLRRHVAAGTRTRPLAKTRPSGPGDLDRVLGPEAAADADHAGRQQRPARARSAPPARPRRRPGCPTSPGRRRSTACGPRAGSRRARNTVPDPGLAGQRRGRARRDGPASAMTVSTPDQVAILAAASFEAMPPLPDRAAGPAGQALELVVDLDHLLDERGLGVAPRVGGEQARRVGEQHQELGAAPGGPPARPAGRCRRSGSPRRPRRRSR